MRVGLDCDLPPERVLLALRDEPYPFALIGAWAGGGAIVGCAPTRLLAGDPFAALDDLPPARGDAEVGGGWFGWLQQPHAHLAFYDHVLRQDAEGKWWFEALTTNEPARERLRALLAAAPEPVASAPAHGACLLTPHGAIASLSPERFLRRRVGRNAALLRATFPPGTGAIGFASPHAGLELSATPNLKGPGPFRLARPDPARGVFETLRVGERHKAHLARLAASVDVLYGETLPAIEIPDYDGAVRIDYRPGGEITVTTRPIVPRALPVVLTPYTLPGGLGAHKWIDRDLLDALGADGTTPLLFDADGTLLEAAWAAVIVRRGGTLLAPRRDGRILPSTSAPPALERDLTLEPGDELFLSSALSAGLLPAVLLSSVPGSQ